MAEENPSQRKKRSNSPKAPGIALSDAVADVGKIFQRYGHASFSKGEMAAALSMSAGGGAFISRAAALRDYALIVDAPGGSKASDLFKQIYQAPPSSSELKRLALHAVRAPAVFGRLLEQFTTRIPDTGALSLRLEAQERFNGERARTVAEAFRSSLATYGLIDSAGNFLPPRDQGDDAGEEQIRDDTPGNVDQSPPNPDAFRVEVPLGPGRRAVVILPEDLGEADVNRIATVLKGFVE